MPGINAARPPRIFAAILALFGAALAGGGAWLLGLGGTPYYVLMGTAVLASAILIWRGNATGSAIFQLAVVATVLWAIWEAGFDLWAILPRIALPILLMVYLYMPWVRKGLSGTDVDDDAPSDRNEIRAPKHATASVALVLLGGAALLGVQQLQAQEGMPQGHPEVEAADAANGAHYASFDQINEDTVGSLQRAWTFDLGANGGESIAPVEANGVLFTCTPGGDVVAVDGASGVERWRVSPQTEDSRADVPCGGLAVHASGSGGICSQRIIGSRGTSLFALDTKNGALCSGFGENGVIALGHTAGRPLATGNTIVTAQGEAGSATLVSAFAAEDGSEKWT